MEQLALLKSDDLRQYTRTRDRDFESVADSFRLQYSHKNGRLRPKSFCHSLPLSGSGFACSDTGATSGFGWWVN